MVTFSDLPYSEARKRGLEQAIILRKIRESGNWSSLSDAEFRLKVLEKWNTMHFRTPEGIS
jgi:hypothetical protein